MTKETALSGVQRPLYPGEFGDDDVITWEMAALIGGSQSAKALQTRFELGSGGLLDGGAEVFRFGDFAGWIIAG